MKFFQIFVSSIFVCACSSNTIISGVEDDYAEIEVFSDSGEVPEVRLEVEGKSYTLSHSEVNTRTSSNVKRIKVPTSTSILASFDYRWLGTEKYYPRTYGNWLQEHVELEEYRDVEGCNTSVAFDTSDKKIYKLVFSVLGDECRVRLKN